MESYYEDDSPLAALLEGRSRRRAFLLKRTRPLTCCCRPWHRRRLVQLPQPGALAYTSLHADCRAKEALAQALYPTPKPPLPCSGHCLQASPCLVGTPSSLVLLLSATTFLHTLQRAVNSRIGRAENSRFLEHFRYLIVASQLLNEYPDLGSLHTTQINGTPFANTDLAPNASLNISGVAATAGVAFVLVLLLNWLRGSRLSKSRILLALLCAAVAAVLFYAYIRRQWLQYLRHQAVDTVSSLTTNARGFDITTSAALSLIQEVELVSKGYRLYARHISSHVASANRLQEYPTTSNLPFR